MGSRTIIRLLQGLLPNSRAAEKIEKNPCRRLYRQGIPDADEATLSIPPDIGTRFAGAILRKQVEPNMRKLRQPGAASWNRAGEPGRKIARMKASGWFLWNMVGGSGRQHPEIKAIHGDRTIIDWHLSARLGCPRSNGFQHLQIK